jgi:CRISPR/Cas system-associated endonuclease Cas1
MTYRRTCKCSAIFLVPYTGCMNALWSERISAYRNTPEALETSRTLLTYKDARRSALLRKYRIAIRMGSYDSAKDYPQALLIEARNAKQFWKHYGTLLPSWCIPFARKPQNKDGVNRLLDIGYHHLAHVVEKHSIILLCSNNVTATATIWICKSPNSSRP